MVLISGLGAVGLGGVIAATFYGARVIALEPNEWRGELAKRLGCEQVIDPRDADAAIHQIMEITGGHGVDKSIECSSQETAPAMLVRATRRLGQITSVGWGGPVNARDLVGKGLTFHGQWHWNHQLHAREMFRLIRGTREKLDQFITHRLPMSKVKDAWELQAAGRCGKIVLHPWD
jgi:threonine dehydrogenase-like Zn-dependent dehydrogenase